MDTRPRNLSICVTGIITEEERKENDTGGGREGDLI